MIQKPPTRSTASAHQELSMTLPFGDTADVDDAARGFLGSWEPGAVRAADGRAVWESDSYAFLNGEAPATVNPSLWRQSTLVAKQGLFEVVEGAIELREGNFGTPAVTAAPAIVAQLTPAQLFDSLAISVDGPRAWGLDLSLDVTFTDIDLGGDTTGPGADIAGDEMVLESLLDVLERGNPSFNIMTP